MAENSGIEWCDHTFNPWIGCTKVSPACDHCYAEEWDQRFEGGEHWGPKAPRRRTSESNWIKPLKWNREAGKKNARHKVFCASLADVFDNKVDPEWRADLFYLIKLTKNLDWLLLTKRPQNIKKMLPDDWGHGAAYPNVWLGTTVENQEEANRRIPPLLDVPARVRFLSCEPLLGPLNIIPFLGGSTVHCKCGWCETEMDILGHFPDKQWCTVCEGDVKRGPTLSWIITGGESGPNYRPADPDWFRALRDQCAETETPFLFKQWEGKSQKEIKALGRELDGVVHDGYPINR